MTGLACILILLVGIFWLQGTGKYPTWENYPNTELIGADSLYSEIPKPFVFDIEMSKNATDDSSGVDEKD